MAEVLDIAPANASRLLTRARAKASRLAALARLAGDDAVAAALEGKRRRTG